MRDDDFSICKDGEEGDVMGRRGCNGEEGDVMGRSGM